MYTVYNRSRIEDAIVLHGGAGYDYIVFDKIYALGTQRARSAARNKLDHDIGALNTQWNVLSARSPAVLGALGESKDQKDIVVRCASQF